MNSSELRLKWKSMLTGNSPDLEAETEDVDISAAWKRISDEAGLYFDTLLYEHDSGILWHDLTDTSYDLAVLTSCRRMKAMALAYSTTGCELYRETRLLNAIIKAMERLIAYHYNKENAKRFRLWFHVEIGIPLELNDCLILLHDELPSTLIHALSSSILHYSPDPIYYNYTSLEHHGTRPSTGANRLWKCAVHMMLGAVLERDSMIAAARDAMLPVLEYASIGDGFHKDGSFIQHHYYAYNGGYGKALLGYMARLLNVLSDSKWEVLDPRIAHIGHWIEQGFLPLIYKGGLMDMSRGREVARSYQEDHQGGHQVIDAVLEAIDYWPGEEAERWAQYAVYWIRSDLYRRYYSYAAPRMIRMAKRLEQEEHQLPVQEPCLIKIYAGMDRVAMLRPDFGLSISMYSSRIASYESISGVNRKGWYTGFGMTQLYTNDLDQFSEHFWPTVDWRRLPGTTVDRGGEYDNYGAGRLSSKSWAGGAELDGKYGTVGMELEGYPVLDQDGAPAGAPLAARKSWFLFDNYMVCLGSNIVMHADRQVETIVDNRRLEANGDQRVSVNGMIRSLAADWTHHYQAVNWIHLTGSSFGADIGYYFPEPTSVKVICETRMGRWSDIGIDSGGSVTNRYLTVVIEHGMNPVDGYYCYAIVPGATERGLEQLAACPTFEVLENTEQAHAVKHKLLGMTGVNFWQDEAKKTAAIRINTNAAVMVMENDCEIHLAIAEPTQQYEGEIELILDTHAAQIVEMDPEITIHALSPKIILSIPVHGSSGRTFQVKLRK